jgi:hypothetical protein
MACCKCCCEAGANPGVCCGLPGSQTCCRDPKHCCKDQLCCEESETCCGTQESPVCCESGTSCCGPGCCPDEQLCCEGNCCAPGECCVDGSCVACDCDPPCSTENCEVCTEVSSGVFDCVTSCTGGQVCCGGVCQECCGDADCPEGEVCVDGTCQSDCDPPCTGCDVCTETSPGVKECVSSCTGGQLCCTGVCQECCVDADCTPPAGEVAQCCDGVCKNTLDDTGFCRDADTGECYAATFDDCGRANQSNTFDLCSCPPGPLAMQSVGLVGTQLKALLSRIGIKSSPTCSCNKRAKIMDENGIEWCEQNVETICDWLAEESAKRKLPFVRLAGKALIHLAIRRAKKGNNK